MKIISRFLSPLNLLPVVFNISLLFSVATYAQGNLLVTPKRVVFEGTNRSEELNLANIGKDSATYVISFIQIRMKDDGTFERITEPDSAQFFADKNLRVFPRTVTLAPNEAQTVKLQVTKSDSLTSGEYRSHLYFRAIPKETPLGEVANNKDTSISVKLVPIFGISIPAIIRVGMPNVTTSFSNIAFTIDSNATPLIKLTINRSGNISVYGDILVDHISAQGKVSRVGVAKGLSVYTPNRQRNFSLQLNTSGVNYRAGKLRITYADQTSKANKLAEIEVELQEKNAVANNIN